MKSLPSSENKGNQNLTVYTPTLTTMLTLYESKNKVALVQQYGNVSMMQVLEKRHELPSIYKSYQEQPEELLRTLKLMLIDFAKSVNVAKTMTPDQVDEAAALILYEYKSLKLEEVFIVLKEIKLGKRVKINERLDVAVITAGFNSYMDDRMNASATMSEIEHQRNKSGWGGSAERVSKNGAQLRDIMVSADDTKKFVKQQQDFTKKKK